MGYKGIFKYIGFLLVMALFLTGCQDSGGQREPSESQTESQDEEFDIDAEEYFNSLLEGNKNLEQDDTGSPGGQDGSGQTESQPTDESQDEKQDTPSVIEVGTLDKENGYMEEIPMGQSCLVDLNNDGHKDTIKYNAVTSSIADYGTTVESFVINNGDYRYTLYLSDQGIHIQDPDLVRYFITDINTRDSYKEVAILDHGANGIPYTYFIRFVGSGTYCLGYVPYFPDDENFKINGDGSVESAYDLKLLQNWQAPATWLSGSDQLLSSNLTMRKPDVFYPYEDQNDETVTLLKDLKLYESRSQSAKTVDLKASDAAITFTQTDDEHWVYVKQEQDDGKEGWMYMEDKDTIVSGGKKYNRRDVFKNLL